jgi:hypothetical protein
LWELLTSTQHIALLVQVRGKEEGVDLFSANFILKNGSKMLPWVDILSMILVNEDQFTVKFANLMCF